MYFELSLFFLSDWHIFLFLVISINQTKKVYARNKRKSICQWDKKNRFISRFFENKSLSNVILMILI